MIEDPQTRVTFEVYLEQALLKFQSKERAQAKIDIDAAEATTAHGTRRLRETWLGGFALVAVVGAFIRSQCALPAIVPPTGYHDENFALANLGAHALVTIAFIFFCYQVLRLAERLSIPHWWVKKLRDISAALGVKMPVDAVLKSVVAKLEGFIKK